MQAAAVSRTESKVPARKPTLPALTGVRTLLAFAIVLFHFTPAGIGPLYPIVDNGYVFVSFFFLISGYILSYNYLDRPGRLNVRDFWVARMSRLYPVYLLALALFWEMLRVEWQVRSHADFWQGTVASLFLVQGFFPNLATFWNTVAWTLSCEIALYAIFPFLMRVRWPSKSGRLVAVILGLWVVGMVPHVYYILTNPDHLPGVTTHLLNVPVLRGVQLHTVATDRYSGGYWMEFLKYTPLPYFCTFVAGVALGKLQSVWTHDVAGADVGVCGGICVGVVHVLCADQTSAVHHDSWRAADAVVCDDHHRAEWAALDFEDVFVGASGGGGVGYVLFVSAAFQYVHFDSYASFAGEAACDAV